MLHLDFLFPEIMFSIFSLKTESSFYFNALHVPGKSMGVKNQPLPRQTVDLRARSSHSEMRSPKNEIQSKA